MDFLIDGQMTTFCPNQHEADLLTLIIACFICFSQKFFVLRGTEISALAGMAGPRPIIEKKSQFDRAWTS